MNKFGSLILGILIISFASCATTKRPYPSAYYQCEKTGEIFAISKSIDEDNLVCPDKTCGAKLIKVASYKRYGSGLNTRYGYNDPWEVGYSGPYVGSRSYLGFGFHRGGLHHHHHHNKHDGGRPNSKPKDSDRTFSKNIPNSSNGSSTPSRPPSPSPTPSNSNSSRSFSKNIPSSRPSSSSSQSSSKSFSKNIPSKKSN